MTKCLGNDIIVIVKTFIRRETIEYVMQFLLARGIHEG